jgi:lysophospholipase L1-like esterase
LRRTLKALVFTLKWAIILLLCTELTSFLIITVSNYILYGHPREGSRARYDPYTLFLMTGGVRPTAFNRRSSQEHLNRTIWVFGGSTLRGDTTSDEKTIPSVLSKTLNSEAQPLHFTVVNFGVNSFNSLLETKYLQKMLIERDDRPDLVIFYDGANDTKYFAEYRSPYGHYGYRRAQALIESYYKSWIGLFKPLIAAGYSSYTREVYHKLHQVILPLKADTASLRKMVDSAERRYRHVRRMTRCYGADFLLVWQPMRWVQGCGVQQEVMGNERSLLLDPDRFSAVKHNFTVTYSAIAARLKNKPFFLDFRDALCGRSVSVYRPDGVHLTQEGRRIVAHHLSEIVKRRVLAGSDSSLNDSGASNQ